MEEFNFEYDSLKLELSDLEKFIGYSEGETPDHFREIMQTVISDIPNYVKPVCGYEIFPVESFSNNMIISGCEFKLSKMIEAKFRKSEKIALFAGTIGSGITALANDFTAKGDILHSYIIDTAGSVLVEKTIDKMQEALQLEMEQKNLKITNRYSPGYCDWDVKEQQKLFSLLPKGFCGIQLSDTSLMTPIKSVSGFIGIGRDVKFSKHDCSICGMENCIYRNK